MHNLTTRSLVKLQPLLFVWAVLLCVANGAAVEVTPRCRTIEPRVPAIPGASIDVDAQRVVTVRWHNDDVGRDLWARFELPDVVDVRIQPQVGERDGSFRYEYTIAVPSASSRGVQSVLLVTKSPVTSEKSDGWKAKLLPLPAIQEDGLMWTYIAGGNYEEALNGFRSRAGIDAQLLGLSPDPPGIVAMRVRAPLRGVTTSDGDGELVPEAILSEFDRHISFCSTPILGPRPLGDDATSAARTLHSEFQQAADAGLVEPGCRRAAVEFGLVGTSSIHTLSWKDVLDRLDRVASLGGICKSIAEMNSRFIRRQFPQKDAPASQ